MNEIDKPILAHSSRQVQQAVRGILRHRRHTAMVSSAALLLLTTLDVDAQQASPATAEGKEEITLTEVVVTAQRRTQSLQDVPYNISAIDSGALRNSGIASMNALTQLVPGLMTVDQGPATRGGNNNFTLRGLRTDPPGGGAAGLIYHNLTVSPVSTYFGETPVFFQMPLDDLERVEVLRGPQGTLYGSGAQAGTIRFIPKRPQLGQFTGEVTGEGSYTQHSPNGNGSVHGVLNIPIADNLALRVVAGEDHLAGFIDAVNRIEVGSGGTPVPSIPGDLTSGFVLGPVQKGTNSSDQWFARTSLRWQPTDAVDAQLDYLHEHTSMADSQWGSSWKGGNFDSSFGVWPNAMVDTRPGCHFCSTNWLAEPYGDGINLVDLVATVDVGLATISSSSSYYDDHSVTNFDQTGLYYGTASPPNPDASSFLPYFPYNSYPRLTPPMRQAAKTRSFIQELRWVSKPGKYFDYVVGLYYQRQHDTSNLTQSIPGITAYDDYIGLPNPTLQRDVNYLRNSDIVFTDRAVFGELTYHLTGAWQITAGARFFRQNYSSDITNEVPLCGAICSTDQADPNGLYIANNSIRVSSHVKKFNTSYDVSPNLKLYATYSEGFRRGGVSGLPGNGPFASVPSLQTFTPDLAKNYELGVKGSLFEHRLRYFADIYLVDLKNFQFDGANLSSNTGAFNGKDARSQGLELESEVAVTDQLNAGFGYAFTRSYVKSTFDIQDYLPYALVPSLGGTGQTASLFGGPIAGGTPLPGVARHVVSASADYTLPAGSIGGAGWSWKLHLDGSYHSSENSNINPASIYAFVIPSAFIANARLSLDTAGSSSYYVFVRNITNNPDISGGANDQQFSNPYRLRNVGRPRTFGLGIRYQFGNH